MDIRQKFFPVRVLRPWHRVPREAVVAPFLAVFEVRLEGLGASCSSGRCPCLWQGVETG